MRHAKSSWDDPSIKDHDRPLNKRGNKAAPQMGHFIQSHNLVPDFILASTAHRAQQTAHLFAEAAGYTKTIQSHSEFYEAFTHDILQVIQNVDDACQRLMIIGHNPTWESLVEDLTNEEEFMPTAAIAHIELPIEHWKDLSDNTKGTLRAFWRPKEL